MLLMLAAITLPLFRLAAAASCRCDIDAADIALFTDADIRCRAIIDVRCRCYCADIAADAEIITPLAILYIRYAAIATLIFHAAAAYCRHIRSMRCYHY